VIVVVLGAFFAACLAYVGAEFANVAGEFTIARHIAGRQSADSGAVHVQLYAPGHHLDVILFEACRSAVIARVRAFIAGLDTGLELLLCHG
jgi:hypothetical protein